MLKQPTPPLEGGDWNVKPPLRLRPSLVSGVAVVLLTLLAISAVLVLRLSSVVHRAVGTVAPVDHVDLIRGSKAVVLPRVPSVKMLSSVRDSQHGAPQPSTRFSPLVLSECLPGMPRYWAPCLAADSRGRISLGEELIFPAFRVDMPRFPDHASRQAFMETLANENGGTMQGHGRVIRDGFVEHMQRHGQNLVIRDAWVSSPSVTSWHANACMEKTINHSVFLDDLAKTCTKVTSEGVEMMARKEEEKQNTRPDDWVGVWTAPAEMMRPSKFRDTASQCEYARRALLVSTPDAWSFQHFLDRSTRVLEQGAHLMDDETQIITSNRVSPAVQDLYELLGISSHRLPQRGHRLIHDMPMAVEELVFACRSYMSHPYFSERFIERLGLVRDDNSHDGIGNSGQNVLLYLDRGRARRIVNDSVLVAYVDAFVKERGHGDVDIVRWTNLSSWKFSTKQTIEYINKQVTVMFGPHGGAFYNQRFARRNTLVLEIMPRERMFLQNWEEASIMGQNYWMYVLESDRAHNLYLSIGHMKNIARIIADHLDKSKPKPLSRSRA